MSEPALSFEEWHTAAVALYVQTRDDGREMAVVKLAGALRAAYGTGYGAALDHAINILDPLRPSTPPSTPLSIVRLTLEPDKD